MSDDVTDTVKDTVYDIFAAAAAAVPDRDYLVVPASASADYAPGGVTLSYAAGLAEIARLKSAYEAAGYGHGQRVAMLLENRPSFLHHWLALNALGVSVVPVNPFYQPDEMTYLLGHSDAILALSVPERREELAAAAAGLSSPMPVITDAEAPPPAPPAPRADAPGEDSECALMYTSGTTGKPKGCMLSNRYYRDIGAWYIDQGDLCPVGRESERLLTPLPLFHMNAMACSFVAMLLSHNTSIHLDRFHPKTWWSDVRETGATIIHYLGVMPAILLSLPEVTGERDHRIKFGFGANVDPAQHQAFEERFGFPLIEGWAMTETGSGATIAANQSPHEPGTRCLGWPDNCDARIVDDDMNDLPDGTPGNLIVRKSAETPRRGFFSGYYKNEEATEESWKGGWFHTGDVVMRAADGRYYFVDRAKNVIRRSGENIAALEVDSVLVKHPSVNQVAVIAVPDKIRDEEVMACVVPEAGSLRDEATARALVEWCLERLAYYKAPGWILFMDELPVTATNKVRKTSIAEMGGDPRDREEVFDLRTMKKAPKKG